MGEGHSINYDVLYEEIIKVKGSEISSQAGRKEEEDLFYLSLRPNKSFRWSGYAESTFEERKICEVAQCHGGERKKTFKSFSCKIFHIA